MANRTLTEEDKQNIIKAVEAYKNGEYEGNKSKIIKTFNIKSHSSFYAALKREGLYVPNVGRRKYKKCPKCQNENNLRTAKFCFNCGADIRDENAMLVERLQAVLADTKFLPDNVREEASETIRAAMKAIETLVK